MDMCVYGWAHVNAGIAKSDLCGSGDPDTGSHVVV